MPNTAIKVQNVSKVYKLYDKPIDRLKESLSLSKKKYHKEFYALNDVSFEIKKGETVGIIGKNGAGKSTLLKIITGVLTPTSGHMHVNGKISSLLELGTGFNPEMTGYENIYLYGSIMGFTKDEMNGKVDAILSFADIGDFIYQPVKTYSSGMFARLAFATAISIEPDILIVDEALSVGDMYFQQKCLAKMKKIKDAGATILFVSHSLSQVKSFCEKAVYIENGKMIAYGLSAEVCDMYQNSSTVLEATELNCALQSAQPYLDNELVRVVGLDNSSVFAKYFKVDPDFNTKITERSGNGEARFVSIYTYDSDMRQKDTFEAMSKIVIIASLEVYSDIEQGAVVGLLFRDAIGNDLMSCNSNHQDKVLPALESGGSYVVGWEIDFPLMGNIYTIHLGLKPEPTSSYFYDRVFGCAILKIENPQYLVERNFGGYIYTRPNILVEKVLRVE